MLTWKKEYKNPQETGTRTGRGDINLGINSQKAILRTAELFPIGNEETLGNFKKCFDKNTFVLLEAHPVTQRVRKRRLSK
jgi:hypothetical protein